MIMPMAGATSVTSHTGMGRFRWSPSCVPWSKKIHWTWRIIQRSAIAPTPERVPTVTAMASGPQVLER